MSTKLFGIEDSSTEDQRSAEGQPLAVRVGIAKAGYLAHLIDAMHLVSATCGNRVAFLTLNGVREVHLLVTMMTGSGKIENVTYKVPQSVESLPDELVLEADEVVASVRLHCSQET